MISRFRKLFDTTATVDPLDWEDLFEEFSHPRAFNGDSHPGWSATEFDPPKRSLDNVARVHAVILDYDNKDEDGNLLASPVTLDEAEIKWCEFYGQIHTSRSHTAEWPRFRVILPLSRHVSRFEYTALWQQINAFADGKLDPAPKDASRFWYTPGIGDHEGATFEQRRLTGAFLDPDEWLKRAPVEPMAQPNVFPINSTTREARARAYIRKMPPAVSGASGHTALWDVARKVVKDFGLDTDTAFRLLKSEYNPTCTPPWSDKELRHKVEDAVKARVANPVEDRPQRRSSPGTGSANSNSGSAPQSSAAPETQPNPASWERMLRMKSDGTLTKDAGNATLILKNDDDWQGCLEYNSFADQIYWANRPPDCVGIAPPESGEQLADHHWVYVHHWFAKYRSTAFSKAVIWDAILAAAHENAVHPLQRYLTALVWDGQPRLSTWLSQYLAADVTDYVSAVGRWWLISAIARAFQPGCQADHMLILEGGQGLGKSTAMRILGDSWYLGSLPDIRDRDRAAAVLQGNWIVEIGELDAFRGAAATRVKDFLTQPFDEYRAAYARCTARRQRSCVFVGTTNENQYLEDATGARRFWPVKVGHLDRSGLADDRDQLLAEARIAYESGERWHPADEFRDEIRDEQEQRHTDDEWMSRIASWLVGRDGFTLGEVMTGALQLDVSKWDRVSQTRVGHALRRLGYSAVQQRDGKHRVRRYYVSPSGDRIPVYPDQIGSDTHGAA